jgi:hypothetical protein
MESIFLEQDIKVFYVTATSFPEGIQAGLSKTSLNSRITSRQKILWYFLS